MDRFAAMTLFARVVETGSFSKAAASLGLSQPTASKQVAALERRLKTLLLNRTTRTLTVTEIGAAYYEKCKRIQDEMESAESLTALAQSGAEGRLRIGSSVTFGRQIIAPMVLQFARQYPRLRIDLSFDDRHVDLLAQNLDVAVRLGRLADSSLGGRQIGNNSWLLVASPRYLKQHAAPHSPADLTHHNCLVYSSVQGDDVWRFAGRRGSARQIAISGSLRSNNLSTLRAAVLAHMGVAILPRYVVQEDLARKRVVSLLDTYGLPVQKIHAVYPSPRYLPARTRVFIDFLRECFERDGWTQASPALPATASDRPARKRA